MKNTNLLLLAVGLNLMTINAMAQTKQPPTVIADTFAKMFPAAQNVEWREKITNFTVFFTVNNSKCEAKYEKNGGWLSTEETLQWDSLPRQVRDSFKLSKYADWQGKSAFSLRTAEATTQYHLVVTKNDMGRRILFYSPEGKLVRDF